MGPGSPPRWCHLVWTTSGRRPFFKIAAVAAFCERTLRGTCASWGWTADTVNVLADQVHALIAVPGPVPRADVSRMLRRAVTRTLRGSSLPFPREPLWEDPVWCAVLASPAAVTVIRRQLLRRRPVRDLVSQEPSRHGGDVGGLREDEVLERGRIR